MQFSFFHFHLSYKIRRIINLLVMIIIMIFSAPLSRPVSTSRDAMVARELLQEEIDSMVQRDEEMARQLQREINTPPSLPSFVPMMGVSLSFLAIRSIRSEPISTVYDIFRDGTNGNLQDF